jgi:nucleotide-binding universal stress UspA family protein
MDEKPTINAIHAIQDFRSARQKAILREIMARLKGESRELLSYEDVRQKLKAQVSPKKELKEIPIKGIIGSVNRYQDFSRDFLPGQNVNEERWAKVEMATYGLVGLPPIDVYQIDEAYFVSDGNHRVSVAKQLGAEYIQAYVTEVQTRVPLTTDTRLEDLILKSEYSAFLESTNLDQLRPGSDISVTVPGQYQVLEEHISVHRYFMGIEQRHEIPYAEAVGDWFDQVYLPVVEIIRLRGLLLEFPNRTEADLYLWIADHRAALEGELNAQVEVSTAVDDLAGKYSQRPYRIIARIGNKIIKTLIPNIFESGPTPGEWRQSVESGGRVDRLFTNILVPINGMENGWWGLEQSAVVVDHEHSNVNGLFIAESQVQQESQFAIDLEKEFIERATRNGIVANFQVVVGDVTKIICERARWNDLVVLNLAYPPEASLLSRMSSGIRDLVQRCPRPILFTPQTKGTFEHALLAYDGSLKAQEALFISTYLAGQWNVALDVITIGDEQLANDIQGDARGYLEKHSITANYIISNENHPEQIILDNVEKLGIDLLLLGGYGRSPILELTQASDVDEILRQSKIPMLICR